MTLSPKFHSYFTIVRPAVAVDTVASKKASRPALIVAGETVKAAVGALFTAPTVTVLVFAEVLPAESVTVSVTENAPALAKRCDSVTPLPKKPSPKFQS